MSDRGSLVPVNTNLVLETLVQGLLAKVQERSEETPPESVRAVLEADDQALADENDRALDHGLRHAGYLARVVEVEMFEPARRTADWVPGKLRERYARTSSWRSAVARTCGDLARAEPIGKPRPDDPAAMSWRVPGPGGHVRHFLARRTIEEHLRGREEPLTGDPAELKRPWLYGFFVRTCEEALPDEAELDPAAAGSDPADADEPDPAGPELDPDAAEPDSDQAELDPES